MKVQNKALIRDVLFVCTYICSSTQLHAKYFTQVFEFATSPQCKVNDLSFDFAPYTTARGIYKLLHNSNELINQKSLEAENLCVAYLISSELCKLMAVAVNDYKSHETSNILNLVLMDSVTISLLDYVEHGKP